MAYLYWWPLSDHTDSWPYWWPLSDYTGTWGVMLYSQLFSRISLSHALSPLSVSFTLVPLPFTCHTLSPLSVSFTLVPLPFTCHTLSPLSVSFTLVPLPFTCHTLSPLSVSFTLVPLSFTCHTLSPLSFTYGSRLSLTWTSLTHTLPLPYYLLDFFPHRLSLSPPRTYAPMAI